MEKCHECGKERLMTVRYFRTAGDFTKVSHSFCEMACAYQWLCIQQMEKQFQGVE